MVDNDVKTAKDVIKAAVVVVMESALLLIENDPHQWSPRPCSTCRAVTTLIGRPFGCIRLGNGGGGGKG